jgi:hypothetical protein
LVVLGSNFTPNGGANLTIDTSAGQDLLVVSTDSAGAFLVGKFYDCGGSATVSASDEFLGPGYIARGSAQMPCMHLG